MPLKEISLPEQPAEAQGRGEIQVIVAPTRDEIRTLANEVLKKWPAEEIRLQVEALRNSAGGTLSPQVVVDELNAIMASGRAFSDTFADGNDDPAYTSAQAEYRTLRQIVAQLRACGFGSQGGPLEKNIAFAKLAELAEEMGDTELAALEYAEPSPPRH